MLSEHAPTEEQVKCAKTAYDDAQAAASAASETAAAQKAKVEEKADALRRALETLLPGLSEEQAESAVQEQNARQNRGVVSWRKKAKKTEEH